MLSSITVKRKEIDDLLNDVNNLEQVKVKLAEITNLFRNFVKPRTPMIVKWRTKLKLNNQVLFSVRLKQV